MIGDEDVPSIEREKRAIEVKYGPWTHPIELKPGVYTVPGKDSPTKRVLHCLNVVRDFFPLNSLETLRVLDLGCLEGMYALEFARAGANVLGIDGRVANIEKALFAKRVLRLDNCDFAVEDVRNPNLTDHGTFQVILCVGILYHLDAPDIFSLLERMSEMCTGLAIVDTHIAEDNALDRFPGLLGEPTVYRYKDEDYAGRFFTEYTTETPEQKLEKVWASLDNSRSFWLERRALHRALVATGFGRVYEDLFHLPRRLDRVMCVAIKT